VIAEHTDIKLYDERDLSWIAIVVDHVMDTLGQPWRVLRERLEHSAIRSARVTAILGALRRVTGGRAERARVAQRVRGLVLGHPALDEAARHDRLASAAETLGLLPEEVADLLWIDLADERPVALPDGRPDERRLAALANLERIQKAVRRARQLRLRIWGDAHELIRTARRHGLLVSVSREKGLAGLADTERATVLDVVGPLSLFHATAVYGRALASLVPLLADQPRFELVIHCDFGYGPAVLRVVPPVLLPRVPAGRAGPSLAARLATDLARCAPDVRLERDPPPLACDDHLLFPDLRLERDGRSCHVEVVGFATAEYVTARLARYRAAGAPDVVLCVDDRRADEDVPVAGTLRYDRRIDPAAVLAYLARG